jgi:hypothetical protein
MRVFNRLFLLVMGVALAAAGVLVVIEAAWAWAGSGPVGAPVGQWLATFKATPWSAPIVVAISVAVAAAGLVLVVAELRPQRKRHAVFATGSGEWLLLRRSTEGHLQRRLAAQVPADGVKVRLTPRTARWRLKVRARAASGSKPALQSAARDELGRLHAPGPSTVEVATSGARRVS